MAARTRAKPDADAPEEKPPVTETPPPDPRRRACRVRAGTLRAAVKDVTGVVAASATIPILSHVRFEAVDGRIALAATNLDVWAQRDCATDDRDGPGSAEWVKSIRGFAAALPAKVLEAILGEVDADAMVTIALEPAASNADHAVISAGRSRFRLHCLPAEDFPLPPPWGVHASFEWHCGALADAFARVEHAISTEETRYYLNGIFLHAHQAEGEPLELRFVTTDGHRLARFRTDPPEGAASFPATIVMRQTVALLDRLLRAASKAEAGDDAAQAAVLVEISDDAPGALLRFSLPAADGGEITVTAKSIDGTYPDYHRVVPDDPPHVAMIDRAALSEAVKRVGVLTSDKTRAVRAVFGEDRLELVVNTPELGEAREELPCHYAGPEVSIGFNGVFWREALAALACETVSMAFDAGDGGSNLSPVLLRPAGEGAQLVQVLMPMRMA